MSQHTYMSSIDYINNLIFDYVETYSFQQGILFEETIKNIRTEYLNLMVRKENQNDLTSQEKERFLELQDHMVSGGYLIDGKGHFHPSSTRTHTLKSTDPLINRLKTILQTEIKDVPGWMCAPMYRDAFVFYDSSNRIVSTLNVCLGCEYMETKMFNHIDGDNETYNLLRQFFIDLGHEIEDK